MRTAVISDIHGNLEALEAVLRDIDSRNIDRVVCLGDTVGYGADPEKCVDLVRRCCAAAIMGNHEDAVLEDRILDDEFRKQAADSIYWTRNRLNPERTSEESIKRAIWNPLRLLDYFNKQDDREKREERWEYLKNLPHELVGDSTTYVHGSPNDPIFEYLSSGDIAILNPDSKILPLFYRRVFKNNPDKHEPRKIEALDKLRTNFDVVQKVCFNGHNHIPCINIELKREPSIPVEEANEGYAYAFPQNLENSTYPIGDEKAIINVGSVGQPRNCDPRASYFIYDSRAMTAECRRVEYDIAKAAAKIRENGFDALADRLFEGK